jgi:hypothetical protein
MPDRPEIGTHGQPPEEKPAVDGVVLYDPTPVAPRPDLEPEQGRRAPSTATIVLVLAAVGLGGYQLFLSPTAPAPEQPAVPELVPSGLTPVEAALTPLGGAEQSVQVGTTLTLEVRARGSAGTPIVDSLVQFVVLAGEGRLEPDASRTDANGVARITLDVPTRAGENLIVARLVGSELEARIRVTGRPGPAVYLTLASGNGQALPSHFSLT